MIRIDFVTDLGARVTVDVENENQLLLVQRQYGRLGWTSGDIPAGGYQFPFDNAEDFDWSLIGARKWVNPEGEEMIIHKGLAYRRRELEAVDSRKLTLPKAVKYSRGARGTDPEHVKEIKGEFAYVTLVFFRGGKRQEKYAVPSEQSRPAQSQASSPVGHQPQVARPTSPRPRHPALFQLPRPDPQSRPGAPAPATDPPATGPLENVSAGGGCSVRLFFFLKQPFEDQMADGLQGFEHPHALA